MSTPTTRAQFKDYCLRRLGKPVIQINVDDDQVNDRIDDALQFFQDYHFDGVEKVYLKHQLNLEDYARKWIYTPDVITGVVTIFPFDDSSASINMFDLRYQLRLHDLYDFTSVSYVAYEITMQHLRTLNLLFSGTPQIRFNRHMNKLFLDVDWQRDIQPGQWIIIECYRKLNPDNFTIQGTVSTTAGDNHLIGSGTILDHDLSVDDEITVGNTITRVANVLSSTSVLCTDTFANTESGLSVVRTGLSVVWDDRFLKRYATALIKQNWGSNLKKFGNIQMPGGVILNGKEIYDEATAELEKLEQEMSINNMLPQEFFLG